MNTTRSELLHTITSPRGTIVRMFWNPGSTWTNPVYELIWPGYCSEWRVAFGATERIHALRTLVKMRRGTDPWTGCSI